MIMKLKVKQSRYLNDKGSRGTKLKQALISARARILQGTNGIWPILILQCYEQIEEGKYRRI